MKTKSLSTFIKAMIGVAVLAIPLSIATPILLLSNKEGELEQHANSFVLKPTLLGKQTLPLVMIH